MKENNIKLTEEQARHRLLTFLENIYDKGYSRGFDDGQALLNEDDSENEELDFWELLEDYNFQLIFNRLLKAYNLKIK